MDANITIIGAGVIGLAIAKTLSESEKGLFLVERHTRFGQETSSRNSEVIHSGVYYNPGSFKAKFCVEGRQLLYNFCREYNVPHNKCGKLIVANTHKEEKKLDGILSNSRSNGVEDARKIEPQEIRELEPNIRAASALFYPSTGIIDSHGLMKQLEALASLNGVDLAYGSEVLDIEKIDQGYRIHIKEPGGTDFSFTTRVLINSAGLEADRIAQMVGIDDPRYEIHFWKGEYFSVAGNKSKYINRLIYPVPLPEQISLGIHATVDLGKQMKLGPNVLYMPERVYDYSIDPAHAEDFYTSASSFLPFLEREDLFPGQCGIRPKLFKPGEPVADYIIREEASKGYPGFVNLLGIESPGLTACLAIAEYVKKILSGR